MFLYNIMTAGKIIFLLVIIIGSLTEPGRLFWRKQAVYLYLILTAALVAWSAYFTYAQFTLWKNTIPGKYLLPPYQPASYFIQYAFFHFWSHFLAALVFSLIILLLAKYFNKRHGQRYFWPEEPWYIALAILAVGYPGWVVYFLLILVMPVLWAVFVAVWRFGEELRIMNFELRNRQTQFPRISYYYLWLSLALVTIILNLWLATFAWWGKFII